jgi:hypothetical protein
MKICIGFLYHLTTSRLADAASFQPSKASMMTHFIPAPLAERLFMGLVATFYVDTCSMPVPVPQMPLASVRYSFTLLRIYSDYLGHLVAISGCV